MRWMLLTETYPPEINGVAMTLARVVEGLIARGHHVKIIRPKQNRHDRHSPPGANPSHRLVWGIPLPWYKGLHLGLPYFGQLRRQIRAFKPDFIHVATEGPLGLAGVLAAHAYGVPIVSSYHTNFFVYGRYYGPVANTLRLMAFPYFRALHNATLRTFVPSTTELGRLQAYKYRNLAVMSRGVDTELFSPQRRSDELRKAWGAGPEDIVMIYVGRIAAEKNLSLMIECYKRLKARHNNAKMVLVGDGPEKALLQKEYPHFIFAGKRTSVDLARHYASADLFIFPSFTETYGNVLMEALGSGLIVLSYDYAAARENIVDGKNGYLAAFKNETAFMEKFETLLAEKGRWWQLAREGRMTALELSWEKVVAKYEADLLSLKPNA